MYILLIDCIYNWPARSSLSTTSITQTNIYCISSDCVRDVNAHTKRSVQLLFNTGNMRNAVPEWPKNAQRTIYIAHWSFFGWVDWIVSECCQFCDALLYKSVPNFVHDPYLNRLIHLNKSTRRRGTSTIIKQQQYRTQSHNRRISIPLPLSALRFRDSRIQCSAAKRTLYELLVHVNVSLSSKCLLTPI